MNTNLRENISSLFFAGEGPIHLGQLSYNQYVLMSSKARKTASERNPGRRNYNDIGHARIREGFSPVTDENATVIGFAKTETGACRLRVHSDAALEAEGPMVGKMPVPKMIDYEVHHIRGVFVTVLKTKN